MTTLDPRMVEAAAKAIYDTYGQGDKDRARRIATAVLTAVDPLCQADTVPVDRNLVSDLRRVCETYYTSDLAADCLRRLSDPDLEKQ